jgi:hypothetical protein
MGNAEYSKEDQRIADRINAKLHGTGKELHFDRATAAWRVCDMEGGGRPRLIEDVRVLEAELTAKS